MIHPPRMWLHKVDNTFVITHHDKNNMLAVLGRVNKKIKSTVEEVVNEAMSFLHCLIPSHTDQYSNFYSSQRLLVKLSTMKFLTKRAAIIFSNRS